jgi:hypothetical protein
MPKWDEMIAAAERYKQAIAALEKPETVTTRLQSPDGWFGCVKYNPHEDELAIEIRGGWVTLRGKEEAVALLAALKELYE